MPATPVGPEPHLEAVHPPLLPPSSPEQRPWSTEGRVDLRACSVAGTTAPKRTFKGFWPGGRAGLW